MPNRDIGIDVRAPPREPAPGDRLNPFNGSLRVRGSIIVGTVVSARMQGTVIVEKQHQRVVEKYERIAKRTRRYPAHVPGNLDVQVGDEVVIGECRPLSKTVSFVVVENRGNPTERHKEESRAKAPPAAKPSGKGTAAAKPPAGARKAEGAKPKSQAPKADAATRQGEPAGGPRRAA